MKSKTVEGIFIVVIVAAALLLLPFFVPYEGDEQSALRAGQYSIGEDEEPETFIRIIERVGSFYGIKHRKNKTDITKTAILSKNTNNPAVASLSSSKGKLTANKDFKHNKFANTSVESVISANGEQVSRANANKTGAVREIYRNKTETEKVEYNGKIYPVEPDAYGNKYIITDKGPVALDSALKQGGRFVNGTKAAQERDSYALGNRNFTETNLNSAYLRKTVNDISKSKTNKINGFNSGKMKPVASGSKHKDGAGKSFLGNSGNKSFGNYDFNSQQDYDSLTNTLHANSNSNIGGGSSSSKTNTAVKKIYTLQNSEPTIGEKPKGISVEDTPNTINTIDSSDISDWGDAILEEKKEKEGNIITITLSEDYEKSDGILPESKSMRSMMTKELLNGKIYTANTKQGVEENPWILPNDIKDKPGDSFYQMNQQALTNGTFTKLDWDESDRYYIQSQKNISETSGGKYIPVAIIDRQKDAFTMNTMPPNTFYYKTTSGLLSGKIVDAAKNGTVDISSIDKNNVLVIVPEKSLADNLKKDGYKVALFDRYLITPSRLKKFYGQTVSAVQGIAQARENDSKMRKENLTRSLSDFK